MPSIYTVTTTADTSNPNDGLISLREAIALANANAGNDQINFNLSGGTNPYEIYLTSALPDIINASTTLPGGGTAGNITISGPGASSLTINGNQGNYSIFKVNTGGNLTISGVTVTGANLTGSGGAFNNSGTLNIYSSTISGNSVTGNGGGIFNGASGTLTVSNSIISTNSANHGAGIYNAGTATVTTSTLNNNTATNDGGGINSNSGTLTLTNSTISGNTASTGGGIINFATLTVTNSTISGNTGGIFNFNTLNIANTIIANSTSGADYSSGGGTIGTNLNNLVENGSITDASSTSPGTGNISGDPLLGPLTNNGGPTETMALLTGSPAIATGDATISNAAPISGLDQRGYTRSFTAPSIGAFEYNGTSPALPTITSVSPTVGSPAGGASISITGTNLAGATAVTIGGTAVQFTVVSATSITTTTPAHTAGAVSVEVTTPGGTNAANTLYSYAPSVTPSTNNLAINATTLTITGTGFDPIAANNTVSLSSGATGTVTSATPTQLTVTLNTAPTLGTLGVVVSTNGTSSGNEVPAANIVNAPVITSISPAAGPKAGGNVIIIKGLNFNNNNLTGVTIGGIAATNVTVNDGPVNSKYITATIPAGVFGPANVLVTTIDGTNSTTANSIFNYTSGSFDAPAEPFSPAFPHAISINAPGSIVGTSASFTVTFNQPVTGVDATDFTLTTTGTVAGGTISSITGSGATRTVNVTGITGAGTLGLNLVNSPTITALPSFAAQATVATGSKPASVTLADVNGDGEFDIITANYNSANVSVLLGNGNGTFKAQQTFATGTQPFSVTLGDVNGDGSLDIITANKGSNNASVLLGNGDGAFKAQTTFATGTQPRSVALGDVNGDGTLDIVTANQGSSNVSVLLGTGNGSFAGQAVDTLNAAQSYSVALGDVNGDGKLDIVAGNRSGSKGSLLLGNGDGTFQASNIFTVGNPQVFVALGDVNGDGKLDIVAAKAGNDVSVLLGNGNGTFQGPINSTPGTNPRSATLRDVNGDGKLDLLTANYGSTNASVLLGNGNGTFQGAITFATGTNSRSATLGDVNGDGRLDIIAANFNSDNASVILGTGGSATFATFSPQQTFAAGFNASSVALGDLNGDGKLDMVTANGQSDTASVLLSNGNGTFKDQTTVATGDSPRSVILGDVNDDGRLDIITANRDSNNASVLLGNGNGTFQTQTTFTTGGSPRSVALGDVNGDGRLDIITANNNSDNASVLLGNGNGTFQAQATFATGSSPRAVALGDVNDDGKLDLITANNGAASASVLLGNGNGTFQTQATFTTGSNPRSVTVGDVNGDSRLDIITANFADNSVSVLLGNGNGTFAAQSTFETNRPYSVSLGDLNGDGRLDIITASYSSDTTRVLLGNGNGTFAAEVSFAAGDGPLSVALGDLNGDGRLDITTANSSSGDASVLLNSLAFTGQTATVEAIPPDAPSITSITDNAAPITGTIAPGGFTNDTSLLLTGSAEAASTVSIYNGSELLGTTTANNTGAWSYTANLSYGTTTYDFNATATDAPGNISPASSPNYSVTVDTAAPAAPTITSITDDAEPITSTIAHGGFTNDTSLLLTGTAEAASTVSIYNGSTLLGTTTADTTTGAWSYNATGLANGSTYAFNATATDAAGNVSNASSPQQTFTTETGPFSVALGDVNGDGRLDIITANSASNNASVLLGNGNGTFQGQQTFATGQNPNSVALGDVNNDGKLDLITANRDSNTASVLLGNGNGTFQTQTTFFAGPGAMPRSVNLGDVNGDGRLDIITANAYSANVSVLLGNGNGTFQTQATFSTGLGPNSVALGDVDGDGRLDIIAANNNGSNASVLLGNGNGTFQGQQTFATGANPFSVSMGDVNGDGRLDIITANLGSGNVSVLLGNGNGTFGPKTDISTGTGSNPTSVTLGDVNDDGRLDIITANVYSDNVSVLLGNGNGTFQDKQTLTTDAGPVSVALDDVNGDGRLDIITANLFSANVSVLLDSIAFTGQKVSVDTAAPAAPSITSITDNALPITGTIAPGGFTNDTSLDLTGSAEAGSTVSIYNGSTLLNTTTADNTTGAWSYSATGLAGGSTYAFNATATDAAGNVSNASSYSVTVDTAAPAAPSITSITDDAGPITGTIAPDGLTNDTSLDLTGTAEAASSVSIYNGSTLLGTTTADNTTGAWSYSATGLEGGSTYAFNATATDAAGNFSPASSPDYSVTVDTAAPTAPSITSITDDAAPITGTIAPGGSTNDTSLDLTGTAEAASTVSIYNGSTLLGTTTANGTGAWSYSATGLSSGSTYVFNTTAIDAAGNVSNASSYSVTVDTTAPAAPTITSITDDAAPITGTIAPGGSTNDTTLVLTGSAEAASTVSIYNGSELLGTTTADNTTGAWSYSATGLSNGTTYAFNATATDAAGNISPASSPTYSVTVDTTSPSPSPSGITSANANGRYGFGSTITLQVSFTETVYVTGSPTLLLETGSTDRTAVYKSGSGTNTLSFDYTVQLGDRSADLKISSSAALTLQGGSIQDAAGNGASLTLPAPGSLGANAALVIDDSAPSAGTTFTTTQGASGLINKPVVINQTTDPLTGGSVVANTLLVFNNATPDSTATSGLQLRVNSNGSNPAATVTSASDLISFRVSPSITTSGNVSNLDVNGITTSAVAAFQATIQEVDLYFPEAPGSGWNALYKKNKNGGYFLFNYDPLTGLGGILLDRDGINGIDGARLYLKDGALGDFDETVNGRIDDPIGFTTLSTAPSLQLSGDGKGLTVNGVDGTGLWISLAVSSFSSAAQSNLEMYNNDQPLGAIGATLGSGPTGSQAIYLAAGSSLSFRSSDGVGNSSNNPALNIASTPTGYSLGLDADRNGSYTDLMLDISSSIAASSPASLAIARKQLSSSDAILDLTSIAATGITLSLDISTDCGLRNRFGFVKLDTLTGTTYQVAGVSQSDGAAFRSAVLSQFIDPFQGTTTSHRYGQSRQSISWALASSAAGYYAPVMVTQGGEVLTFGASTASDGRQHVKLLGTNTFGFEDLLASQGSDWDFNDTKIRVSVV